MDEANRKQQVGQQMNVNIPADQLKDRICPCGGRVFSHALILKEIPSIYSPSGNYETMMLPIGFVCIGCGKFMSIRPEEQKKVKIVLTGRN